MNYCTLFHNPDFLRLILSSKSFVETFPGSTRLVDAETNSLILEIWRAGEREYLTCYPFTFDPTNPSAMSILLAMAKACPLPLRLVTRDDYVEVGLTVEVNSPNAEEINTLVCEMRGYANGPMRHQLMLEAYDLATGLEEPGEPPEPVDFLEGEESP